MVTTSPLFKPCPGEVIFTPLPPAGAAAYSVMPPPRDAHFPFVAGSPVNATGMEKESASTTVI